MLVLSFTLSCNDKKNQAEVRGGISEKTQKPNMKRIITVYQSEGWANIERAVALVQEYAKRTKIEVEIQRVTVASEADVQRHKFLGSPTMRINGLDISPDTRSSTQYGFGWRLIDWTQGASTTETMLHSAFIEAGWILNDTKGGT